jgi:hypothetical protein
MEHPSEELLLQALHEPQQVSSEMRMHLAGCEHCFVRQEQLAADDRFVGGLLTALDHPLPALSASDVRAASPRRLRRRALLVAEITLAFAAAAAAMTIPASPLHRLLFPVAAPLPAPVREPVAETSPGQHGGVAPVGIALAAPASLVVEFRHAQATGSITVDVTSGSQVTVRSRGGAVGYTVNEGKVVVDNREPATEYVVEIPATLRRARILVGTRVLFFKDGDRLGPVQPAEGARYRIAFTDTTRIEP